MSEHHEDIVLGFLLLVLANGTFGYAYQLLLGKDLSSIWAMAVYILLAIWGWGKVTDGAIGLYPVRSIK